MSSSLESKDAYAIVIGISDYPETDYDLNYCDDDAQDINSILVNEFNFKPENIYYLQDSSASKNAISNAFDQVASQITSNDIFFFYYSGHGGASVINDGIHSYSIDSPHPYSNSYDNMWSIHHQNAAYMRVHFDHFETEIDYDWVFLGDTDLGDGWFYEAYSGYSTGFWSGWIPLLGDNRLYIRFISDSSITDWGFSVDSYEVLTYNGTHFLCSYDSIPSSPNNYYIDSLLDSKLDTLTCAEKYIILDACNTGGMIPEVQGTGRYIMTACASEESSLEDPALEHGVFTNFFLQSLVLSTDSNGDGVKSMEEFYSYVYSNTVSYSGSLGYTHHPQEYDGIAGESVLSTSFGSVSLNPLTNTLYYSFSLYGIGVVHELKVAVCNISTATYEVEDLTLNPASVTGFGDYSGTIELTGVSGLSGYGIYAEIEGNTIIRLNSTVGGDADSDTLDDVLEVILGSDPLLNDSDSDGLDDATEYYGGTDPSIADTDGDLLSDGEEVLVYLTDPLDPDIDDDGLLDGEEILLYFTDVDNPDTDGDGMYDGFEIQYSLDPFVDDSGLDNDNDGLSNLIEFQFGSSPLLSDSDGDFMPDSYEYLCDLDPTIDDTNLDNDQDGLPNLLEFLLGSLANDVDSDGDLLPDYWEYNNNLNLTLNDAHVDSDSDGLDNYNEYTNNLNPQNPDCDNDGLTDGEEVLRYHTNPLKKDTDGDGYSDSIEIKWGTNPLDAKNSLNIYFFNIGGGVVLTCAGYYVVRTQLIKRKKKQHDGKTDLHKFKINEDAKIYNSVSVETKHKPVRPVYQQKPYYQRYYRPSTPTVQPTVEEIKKALIRRLPPPLPSYTPEGRRALSIANMAFEFLNQGRYKESIQYMLNALMLGVPEPMNTRLKTILLTSLDRASNLGGGFDSSPFSNISNDIKKCSWCGKNNPISYKYCSNCGRSL
ncbi:MAG: caspase family protein [Promethearchaeota archaeon]